MFNGFGKSLINSLLLSEHMGKESGPVVMNVILELGYLDLDSRDATF